MGRRVKFTKEQQAELINAYKTYKGNAAVKKRLHALSLYAQGVPVSEICSSLGCSEPSVTLWVRKYVRTGLIAIVGSYDATMKELSEIISAIASEDDPDIKNRLRVILFKKKQISTKTIQKETGYSESAIYAIYSFYRKNGLERIREPKIEELIAEKEREKAKRRKLRDEVFSTQQIAEMREAYNSATDPVLARRYELILLKMQGLPLTEAAEMVDMAYSAAIELFRTYRKNGISALQLHASNRIYGPGIRYQFTAAQAEEVQRAFMQARYLKDKARLEILALSAQGKTVAEIRDATGFALSLIRKDIIKYCKYGLPKSPHGGGVTY